MKIAVIVTEYRRNSHADVIAGRLLAGYDFNGQRQQPRLQVVSMYTDQVTANDMSRDMAAQHGFAIFVFQIDRDAAFVSIHRHELTAHAGITKLPGIAPHVAIKAFYFDNVGTPIAQRLATEWTEQH